MLKWSLRLAWSSGFSLFEPSNFPKCLKWKQIISGSGVFAPNGLITFTKHEDEGAFVVEMVLRNLPSVEPLVVTWEWPLSQRSKLKEVGSRPIKPLAGYPPQCRWHSQVLASGFCDYDVKAKPSSHPMLRQDIVLEGRPEYPCEYQGVLPRQPVAQAPFLPGAHEQRAPPGS